MSKPRNHKSRPNSKRKPPRAARNAASQASVTTLSVPLILSDEAQRQLTDAYERGDFACDEKGVFQIPVVDVSTDHNSWTARKPHPQFKLTADHLKALETAKRLREVNTYYYYATPEVQLSEYERECEYDRERYGVALVETFEQWLVANSDQLDCIHPDAPIYLVSPDLEPEEMAIEVEVEPRIVIWRDFVGFYGGDKCDLRQPGSTMHRIGSLSDETFAGGLYWLSCHEAEPHALTSGQRLGISRAKLKANRPYYYVRATKRTPHPILEPRGGHHSSPVAHDRRAHQALLSRVDVQRDEILDLISRGYNVERTEVVPPDVIERMKLRGKEANPNTLCAWRWIDRRESKVNPDGEQSRRITVVSERVARL